MDKKTYIEIGKLLQTFDEYCKPDVAMYATFCKMLKLLPMITVVDGRIMDV